MVLIGVDSYFHRAADRYPDFFDSLDVFFNVRAANAKLSLKLPAKDNYEFC